MFFYVGLWGYLFLPGNSSITAWEVALGPASAKQISTLDASGFAPTLGPVTPNAQDGTKIYWVSQNGAAILVFDTVTNKFLPEIPAA